MSPISQSLSETEAIVRDFLNTIELSQTASVVALEGDLGAGKTTFTQIAGKVLGVEENMHSPTFVIMKVYEIDFKRFKKFIHIDAYRLEKDEELLHLGWEEMLRDPENLIFIEWPERVRNIIPQDSIKVLFKHVSEEVREIALEVDKFKS